MQSATSPSGTQPMLRAKPAVIALPTAQFRLLSNRPLSCAENSIVVAEGSLQTDGTFKATALGMPPPERREASVEALQGLDVFGGARLDEKTCLEWEALHAEDSIALFSDVWLDNPAVLSRLEAQFTEFCSNPACPLPKLILLAGNFLSPAAQHRGLTGFGSSGAGFAAAGGLIGELQRAFASLARLLARHPQITVRNRGSASWG